MLDLIGFWFNVSAIVLFLLANKLNKVLEQA